MHIFKSLLATLLVPAIAAAQDIYSTEAFAWRGDSIVQDNSWATSPDGVSLVSTYHPQPGYRMGIEPEWKVINDISCYPRLSSGYNLQDAVYNLALDEMVNAVEPDTTLRTGKAWGGVWTRDVSYSIILSLAYMQPEAARVSLMRKVTPDGRIIQDTGSGGAWPVSTDRVIWGIAAWEIYLATHDRQWLGTTYPILERSLADDSLVIIDDETGLIRGETSFIDWRTQSYPLWLQMSGIASSCALGTSAVHAHAWEVLGLMAATLGDKTKAAKYHAVSKSIADAINRHLWMPDRGYYAMYNYGGRFPVTTPRSETLGEALTILWDIAPASRADSLTAAMPVTHYGPPVFFPQIKDIPSYHNNALWPWVAAFWGLASAKTGNEAGVMDAIASITRAAALFCTNKENLRLDNGDIATQLNSSNMLWCLAGNIAMIHKVLFGIHHAPDGLHFRPFVPTALDGRRSLFDFRYGNAVCDITVTGHGDSIASFELDGIVTDPILDANTAGRHNISITMAPSRRFHNVHNMTSNHFALPTPQAWLADGFLEWNPVEDAALYVILKDGVPVDTVTTITYPVTSAGDYNVMAVDPQGWCSFASQPVSNRPFATVKPSETATVALAPEMCFRPCDPIQGYTPGGFAETSSRGEVVCFDFDIQQPGLYFLDLRYANGNGPISTDNKCALRAAVIDGAPSGVFVMPQRGSGNWNDWGYSTTVKANLHAGRHKLQLTLPTYCRNINVTTNHALVDLLRITPND